MEIWGVFGPTNAYRASFVRCRSGRKEGGTTLRFSLCSRLTLVCALGVQPQPRGPVQAGGPLPPSLAPGRLMATRIFGMCAAFHSLVEPHEDFRRVTAFPGLFYRSEHRSDRLSTSPGSPSLPEAEPSLEAGISSLTASPSTAMSRRRAGAASQRESASSPHISVLASTSGECAMSPCHCPRSLSQLGLALFILWTFPDLLLENIVPYGNVFVLVCPSPVLLSAL